MNKKQNCCPNLNIKTTIWTGKNRLFRLFFALALFMQIGFIDPSFAKKSATLPARNYSYRIIRVYPHDPAAYTQGLIYSDGVLYEGTGLNGQSSIRKVDLYSGLVYQKYDLPPEYFGEGIAILDNHIFQLTWQSFTGFVYEKKNFIPLSTFAYNTEGWGLTTDGKNLIMSDGSASLRFFNPQGFREIKQIQVFDGSGPVTGLNELEFVKGYIYSNVYPTDQIVIIDPATGSVISRVDFSGLLPKTDRRYPVDVLNGIAYDSVNERLFVTGKKWPKLFEVKLIPPDKK